MNICLLSTSDGREGGFAAVHRLHANFRKAGHNSVIVVADKRSSDPDVVEMNPPYYQINQMVQQLIRRTGLTPSSAQEYHFDFNSFTMASTRDMIKRLPFKPDVFIACWIHYFISDKHLHHLNHETDVPIVWYLMDMAPFTGGCHYAWDCLGYTTSCGRCPAIHSTHDKDMSHRRLLSKLRYLQSTDLTVVAASTWTRQQAGRARVFSGKRIERVMLGVDPDIFAPTAKEEARMLLRLPLDKKIIFLGSTSLRDKRKGLLYFKDALDILSRLLKTDTSVKQSILITLAGKLDNEPGLDMPFPHVHLGYFAEDRQLARAYQAADVFVCPSVEDSGPMMINESIMCGTPVVSFEMGVAVDLVHTGETGYRAKLKDSSELAQGMYEILTLNKTESERISQNCRDLGQRLCHPAVQVKSFEKLIDSLVNKRGAGA